MDPAFLEDDELLFELQSRGVNNLSDRRSCVRALKIFLDDEAKTGVTDGNLGLKISATRELQFVDKKLNLLLNQLPEKLITGTRDECLVLLSRLIHLCHFVSCLTPANRVEEEKIHALDVGIREAQGDVVGALEGRLAVRVDDPIIREDGEEADASSLAVADFFGAFGANASSQRVSPILPLRRGAFGVIGRSGSKGAIPKRVTPNMSNFL